MKNMQMSHPSLKMEDDSPGMAAHTFNPQMPNAKGASEFKAGAVYIWTPGKPEPEIDPVSIH